MADSAGSAGPADSAAGPRVVSRVRWDWTDLLLVFAIGFVGSVFASWLAIVVIAGMVSRLAPAAPDQLTTALVSTGGQIAFYAGMAAILLGVLRWRRGVGLRELGWVRAQRRWLMAAPLITLATLVGAAVLGVVSGLIFPSATNGQCTAVQKDFGHYLVVALLPISIVAPVVEETFFRGFLFAYLRGRLPFGIAATIAALIFAAAHVELLLVLPLFGVGMVLNVLYQRSGSLFPGMLVHGLFNIVGLVQILSAGGCS